MQQRGKCGLTLQAQVRRRSLGMHAEGGALLRRMEHAWPNERCITKLENAHGTESRELLYPWHPWAGLSVGRRVLLLASRETGNVSFWTANLIMWKN
jgi:hypothetical protein